MAFLHNLKLRLAPPRIKDPEFGELIFIYIEKHPERSYWGCEWNFPATGGVVAITLPGDENGPNADARRFYLALPAQFDAILNECRPKLQQVFRDWRKQQLPQEIFTAVRLTGFEVENPLEQPVRWHVAFETMDDDWLGITIPFVGDSAVEPEVDT